MIFDRCLAGLNQQVTVTSVRLSTFRMRFLLGLRRRSRLRTLRLLGMLLFHLLCLLLMTLFHLLLLRVVVVFLGSLLVFALLLLL